MKLSVATVVGALVAAALAVPRFTNTEFPVEEGVPFELTWAGATGPVTITLMTGDDPNALEEADVIVSGETGDSFTYTPSDIPSGTYAFRIEDSTGEPNYSASFPYTSATVTSSAVSSVTVTRTSTSGSSSATSSASESSSESSTSGVSSSEASSTITATSLSTTTTRASTTTTRAPSSTPNNNNEGQRFSSPIALVLITVAALAFFN